MSERGVGVLGAIIFLLFVMSPIVVGRWKEWRSDKRYGDARSFRQSVVTMLRFLDEAGLKVGDYTLWYSGAGNALSIVLGGWPGGIRVEFVGDRMDYRDFLRKDARDVGIDDWKFTTLRRYVYAAKALREDGVK